MPAKSNTLVDRLLDGLDTKARKDGSVITVKASGKTVAEVCVGKSKTRVNFVSAPSGGIKKLLSGKSKSWPAGGLVVTDGNLALVHAALVEWSAVNATAADAAKSLARSRAAKSEAQGKLTNSTRTRASAQAS